MRFNQLLEFRSLDALKRMTDADRIDLLIDVLEQGPSERTWSVVYELFALWPESDARARSLENADRAMAAWDDRLRCADTSSAALFNGARLSSLARLVRFISIYRRDDGGRSELLAVVTSEEAAHLTGLDIVKSEIGRRAWQTMIDSPYLRNLRHLHVTNTVMGGDIVPRLLQSSGMPHLRCLKLIDIGLSAASLRIGPTMPRALQRIDFSRNLLAHDGALALAESPWLASVERLALRDNLIREPAMLVLLASPFISNMKRVDLSGNDVTDGQRAALVRLAQERQIELRI
jgi:hypothetical protein